MHNANATRAATCPDHATHAADVIEGERHAAAYLDRLNADMAQPAELAVIVAYLRGEMLHGFCRLVQKTLEARHV